jgi:hypothetical protein
VSWIMDLGRLDLESEVARVLGELIAFRAACLPALVQLSSVPSIAGSKRGTAVMGRLEWERATGQLVNALPANGRLGRLDPPGFDFLHEKPVPGYIVRDDRIEWRCEVGVYSMRAETAESVLAALGNSEGRPADPLAQLHSRLSEVRDYLLSLPVGDSGLYNSLCMVLPLLVDDDLGFVLGALSSETWRGLVLGCPGLTLGERLRRMKTIDGYYFGHVLNNALLHVLGSMANNRFGYIPALMDHPYLIGSYTNLMPHYIFSVMLAKVMTLRELVAGRVQVAEGEGQGQRTLTY